MADVYATVLEAIRRDSAGLERVAVNVANMTTPGFKREATVERSFESAMRSHATLGGVEAAPAGQQAAGAALPAGVLVALDPRPGAFRETGRALDVALDGPGYFEIATPSGPAYTRQGSFRVDEGGRLVTDDGSAVMGVGGEINLTTASPNIDREGNVTEPTRNGANGGRVAGRLRVVVFDEPGKLRRIGGGLLSAGQDVVGALAADEAQLRVRQGALEESNVDLLQEMQQLLRTMRHVESMQKVVQGYDELLGVGIRRLGELS